MSGGSFLRITNATLEFVGSSNTVKQKRLLRSTSILGSWRSIYIPLHPTPRKFTDKSEPWPCWGSSQAQTHARWHAHARPEAFAHQRKQDQQVTQAASSARAFSGGGPAKNWWICNYLSLTEKGKTNKVSLTLNGFKMNTFGGGGGGRR